MQSPRHAPKQRVQKVAEPQAQNTTVNEQPAKAVSEGSPIFALQKHVGNQAMQRMIRRSHKKPTASVKAAAPALPSVPVLQRAPNDESSLDVGEAIKVDGQLVGTVDDAIRWYEKRRDALEKQNSEFAQENEIGPERLSALAEEADKILDRLYGLDADAMPDADMETLLNWNDDYIGVMKLADQRIEDIATARLREAQRNVEKILANLKELEPQMRDLQRSAFRKGSESTLKNVADSFALYLDSSLVAKDWLETATTSLKDIKYLGTTLRAQTAMHNLPIAWEDTMAQSRNMRVVKVLDAAEKLNKALAAFQLLSGALDLLGGSKTKSDVGSKGVGFAATFASAGGTLLGASAFFSLYNNFYIGPMVGKILGQLEVLKDMLSTGQNHPLIQMGKLDLVNWDIEPGGREMFDYMMKVMKASSALEIPSPSGDVLEYFDDNESDFNAGAMGDQDLPTKGWLFSSVDGSEARYWIFKHRKDVWGMLYGSMPVPN